MSEPREVDELMTRDISQVVYVVQYPHPKGFSFDEVKVFSSEIGMSAFVVKQDGFVKVKRCPVE